MHFPVTEEQIRTLAFYLWEKDGSPDGRSDEYWLKAQQQLTGNSGEGNSGAGNGGETTSDPAQTRE